MKIRNYFALAMIFAAASVSCQKVQLAVPDETGQESSVKEFGPTVFTLDAAIDENKASLDGLKVKWTLGDQIVVNGITSKPLATIKENGSAVFEFDALIEGDDYYAIYPAAAYVEGSWDETNPGTGVRVDLPKSQTYTAGSFDPNSCIMTSKGSVSGISFGHSVAYLKLTFDKAVKSVRAMANNGVRVKGQMNVNFTDKTIEDYYSTVDWLTATVASETAVAAGEPVIIALPAKNYEAGLNFFVVTDDDQYQILKTSPVDLTSKKGVLLTKSASLASLKTYQGPGIYCEYDWNSFVSAYESVYTTDATQLGDCSDWKGSDGEINIYESFAVEGNLLRLGVNVADRPGVVVSGATVAYFTETLDGNEKTITQSASSIPIITYLGTLTEAGTIKNLTLAGECTAISNLGWSNGSFVIRNFRGGVIKNCVNKINTTYVETKASATAAYFSGFTVSNGGLIEDCTNAGNMNITLLCSGNRTFRVGGIASSNSQNGKCGDFTRCKNTGNITIKKTSNDGKGPWCLTNCGIGGICGSVTLGTTGTKWAGDYTYFDSCTNSGKITFWEDKSGTLSSNQLSMGIGGILGASTQYGTSGCPDFTAEGKGYYFVIQAAANTGDIDVSSANISGLANAMSGARQTYIGGLVGFAQGGNVQGTSNAVTNYPIVRGSNNATIRLGSAYGCEAAGGIIGGAAFVKFDWLRNSVTTYDLTQNPDANTSKVGGVASMVGWVMKRCIVYGSETNAPVLKMDATALYGKTIYAQGVTGITSAASTGAAGTWGTSGSPLIIYETSGSYIVKSAVRRADGTEVAAGAVSTDSGKTNGSFYGGGAAFGKGVIRKSGNLTMVAY